MKKSRYILLVFLFLLPMLCIPAYAEGADFAYATQLTSEGKEVTDLTALSENSSVDLQLDLYRRDVSGSYDIWGVQFSVIVDGMEPIDDTYESNFAAITNTCFQSPLDTSYTDNYVWMDLGQNALTTENPLTLRHSYRITDPFKASVRISYAYVLPKDSKGVTPVPFDPIINVLSVELNNHELSLVEKGSEKLIATVLPENAMNKNVTWSSSNESVATVDANGNVQAIKEGTARITVTTVDGGKKDVCVVTVGKKNVPVTGVTLNTNTLTLKTGGSEKLIVTVLPANATNKDVTWSSSNESVATVDANGKVTARKEGTATITVTTKDGGMTATCVVTVTKADTPVNPENPGIGALDCPRDETCPIEPFTDTKNDAWWHDGIHFCIENDLMVGVGKNLFKPNATTTRSMIVTILWRLEGEPASNYATSFKDVPSGQWYTEAVRWAQSTGVVEGYSAEAFGPADPITREQMATILYRYAKYHGINVANTNALNGYSDKAQVSSWALDAMKWANGAGLVQGRTLTTLVPGASITRAEAAAMIQRYCTAKR